MVSQSSGWLATLKWLLKDSCINTAEYHLQLHCKNSLRTSLNLPQTLTRAHQKHLVYWPNSSKYSKSEYFKGRKMNFGHSICHFILKWMAKVARMDSWLLNPKPVVDANDLSFAARDNFAAGESARFYNRPVKKPEERNTRWRCLREVWCPVEAVSAIRPGW